MGNSQTYTSVAVKSAFELDKETRKLLAEAVLANLGNKYPADHGEWARWQPAKRSTPKPIRGLLFLLLSILALAGMRSVPSILAQGWLPTVSLLSGLALITAAFVTAIRMR